MWKEGGMPTDTMLILKELRVLAVPAGAAIITLAALLVLRSIVFRVLDRWAARSSSKAVDIVAATFRSPTVYWALAVSIYLGIAVSDMPARYLFYLTRAIHILIVLSVTVAAANLFGRVFSSYVTRHELPLPTTGLAQGIIKGTILVLGSVIILGLLGVSIAPIVTALGVGGLAVALAMQDTLANLFAGIHILVEKSIRVGDFIEIEGGLKGYVDDITWRTTRIRMIPNNMVVIPNNKLSQSIVTNYYMPEKGMNLYIPVGVSYSSDPDHIEKVLLEVARDAVGHVDGMLANPPPEVLFMPGFGDSALEFRLVVRVGEVFEQYRVQHELRKRIFKRFRDEGIEIPFPHRTVYIREDRTWKSRQSHSSSSSVQTS